MGSVRLIKNPFDRKVDVLVIDYGDNFKTIVENINLPESIKKRLVIYKLDENLDNPELIPQEEWENTFPKDSEHYQIMMAIQGGGGGGGGKTVLRMVAMVAIMAVAAWAVAGVMAMMGGFAFSAGFSALSTFGASVAIGIGGVVGGLITNALIPPPEVGNQNNMAGENTRTLSGASNSANPYGAVPRIYGKTRFSPYKIAPDYTEVVGETSYIRTLLCFGYGPLKVSDIRIGTNSIANYSEVQYEIREGWPDDKPITLYTNTVVQQNYSIRLHRPGGSTGPQIVTTLANQNEVNIVLWFEGLYQTRANSGKLDTNTAAFTIHYRKNGSNDDWTLVTNTSYTMRSTSPFTRSFRIVFPEAGTYDIRVHQYYAEFNGPNNPGSGYIQTVQNIEYKAPYRASGLCIMAMRIRASDQLNGQLDGVSALCESYEFVPDSGENDTDDTEEPEKPNDSGNPIITSTSQQNVLLGQCNRQGSVLSKTIDEYTTEVSLKMEFPQGMTYPAYSGPVIIGGAARGKYRLEYTIGDGPKQEKIIQIDTNESAFFHTESLYKGDLAKKINFSITKIEDWCQFTRKVPAGHETGLKFKTYTETNTSRSTCNVTLEYKLAQVSWTGNVPSPVPTVKGNWVLNRHPAWHVYDILIGTAAVSPVDPEMIDIESFKEWEKTYPDWLVDVAIDGNYTRLEVINSMCSAGKAYFTMINGKYTIVLDKVGKTPVAAISPRNSFDFSFTKAFEQIIHGFKVKYIEPDRDWTEQEVIVYNTGYDSSNASNFESLETYGCTDRTRAWKYGKYMLAQYVLRPETYTLTQDIENLAVNIGDLVMLSHDVLKVGIGSARVKEVYLDEAGRATSLWLDDFFYLPSGSNYSVIIRDSYGKLSTYAIDSNESEEDVINFTTSIPQNLLPAAGDMVFIGITDRMVMRSLITKIEPGDDLTATLTLVPEAPEVHDESDEEVPPFDSMITDTPEWSNKAPLAPIVDNIIADERALIQDATGGYKAAVSFDVRRRPEETEIISFIQVYTTKDKDSITYRDIFPYTGTDTLKISHVEDAWGATIQVRFVSDKNMVSEWTEFYVYVEGKSNPPPDVLNLDRQGYNITWNYDDKPLDFAGFRVYYNYGYDPWMGHAVKAHSESLWSSPPYTTEFLPKEEITIFVVAVDTAGNESKNPAILSFNNGDVEYDNVLWSYDYAANNFPGTINDGNVFRNTLLAIENQNFWKSDGSKFWKEDAENFYDTILYSPMEYMFSVPFDGSVDEAYIKLEWDIEGVYKIYYLRENKDPFYPPLENPFYKEESEFFYSQSEWQYLMPDKLLIGNERVYIKIVWEDGLQQGKINALKASIDAPDITELLPNVPISADGTRLHITKNFKAITQVFLTLVGGNTAVTPRVVDYNAELGPMIAVLDINGNRTTGIVNADVRGYK